MISTSLGVLWCHLPSWDRLPPLHGLSMSVHVCCRGGRGSLPTYSMPECLREPCLKAKPQVHHDGNYNPHGGKVGGMGNTLPSTCRQTSSPTQRKGTHSPASCSSLPRWRMGGFCYFLSAAPLEEFTSGYRPQDIAKYNLRFSNRKLCPSGGFAGERMGPEGLCQSP